MPDLNNTDIAIPCTFVSKNKTIISVNIFGLIGLYLETIYAEVINHLKKLKGRNLYRYFELLNIPKGDQNMLASVFFP